jgi:hypothetical protein
MANKIVHHTQCNTDQKSVGKASATMLELLKTEEPNIGRRFLPEIFGHVSEIERNYPQILRTSPHLNADNGFVLIHNSPHYGNTTLARLADVLSTAKAIRENGVKLIEIRTTVDTTKIGTDGIYFPGTIIGASVRNNLIRAGHFTTPEFETPLNKLRNPISTEIAREMEKDAASIQSAKAREFVLAALFVLPEQKTYALASRLFNLAVHKALLAVIGVDDYLVDIPLSAHLALPEASKRYETGMEIQKLPEHRNMTRSPQLFGYVASGLSMNPHFVKGGRQMHEYYESIALALNRSSVLERVPPLVKVPEIRLRSTDLLDKSTTIPTINEAIEMSESLLRQKV